MSVRHALASDTLAAQKSLNISDSLSPLGDGSSSPPQSRSKITNKRRSTLLEDNTGGLPDSSVTPGNNTGRRLNKARVAAAANSLRTAGSKIVKQMRRRSEFSVRRMGSNEVYW